MKSLAVVIFYIVTVCGVFAYPSTTVASSSTPQQKNIEQKTDDWNKGLTSYPSFFVGLNVPTNLRGFVSSFKSTSNGKINLIDKEAPLVGIAPQSEPVSNSSTVPTISNEIQAKKDQKDTVVAPAAPSNEAREAPKFVVQHLVDIPEKECSQGFGKDPNGDCQKIEN